MQLIVVCGESGAEQFSPTLFRNFLTELLASWDVIYPSGTRKRTSDRRDLTQIHALSFMCEHNEG